MIYVTKIFNLFLSMLDLVTSNTLVETFWYFLFLTGIVFILKSLLIVK